MEERRPTAEWNEFDWERALRESDNYAARYFRLLQRFCDLPGADDLITRQLAREFNADQALPDCDGDCASCDLRWNCEFALHTEWDMGRGYGGMDEEMAAGEMADDEAGESDVEALEAGTKGDPLFFETSPTFHLLRQTALGWCNVYSVILPGEAAETGLRILYHIGRALANLSYSIGDGLYEQPKANIAFGKRCLEELNTSLGLIQSLTAERPRLGRLLLVIQQHLLRTRQEVIDHVGECRGRTTSAA
jgi:hypothetical protein